VKKIRQRKIDQFLYRLLVEKSLDKFTVLNLRDAYIRESQVPISPKEARNRVYALIHRYTKQGLLVKETKQNSRESIYSKTSQFHCTEFYHSSSKNTDDKRNIYSNSTQSIGEIEKKLDQYQVDLLASIAESEEYMKLYETNPELKEALEPNYHQAREQSSKLLGQIKALKAVISHYEYKINETKTMAA